MKGYERRPRASLGASGAGLRGRLCGRHCGGALQPPGVWTSLPPDLTHLRPCFSTGLLGPAPGGAPGGRPAGAAAGGRAAWPHCGGGSWFSRGRPWPRPRGALSASCPGSCSSLAPRLCLSLGACISPPTPELLSAEDACLGVRPGGGEHSTQGC